MDNSLLLISNAIMDKLAVSEITNCNEITYQYGLILSHSEALELVEARTEALSCNERIEFSGGTITKLIMEFCDSPYISQSNYTTTMNELIEIFYYYKNETLDKISDDELISLMKKYFNRNCQGSLDLLKNRELANLARNIRFGVLNYADQDEDIQKPFEEDLDDE